MILIPRLNGGESELAILKFIRNQRFETFSVDILPKAKARGVH
jgi:hypothetical protein